MKPFLTVRVFLVAGLFASFAALALALPVQAGAVIPVTTFTDELNAGGACSLREALRSANTNTAVGGCPTGAVGEDIVVLGAGTYTLNIGPSGDDAGLNGDLDATQSVVIQGAGQANTTIGAAAGWSDRILETHPGASVKIVGVTITDGNILTSNGGGIQSWQDLTLVNSTVYQNNSGGFGGGIASQNGVVALIKSTVAGNTSTQGSGGISASSVTLLVLASNVVSNSTNGDGGGLSSSGTVTVTNSTISYNQAAGSGGGMRVNGPTVVLNSTLRSNVAVVNGGGLFGSGFEIMNSTISGNDAWQNGGGIYKGTGNGSLYSVTIAANRADADQGGTTGDGGGLYNGSGVINLRNTIVANNTDLGGANNHPDCSGTLTSGGYNLVRSGSGCVIIGDTTGNLPVGTDPLLAALANNGGPTVTHALQTSPSASPAINAGNPGGCTGRFFAPLSADQRSGARAGRCDMGSYEANACLLAGDVDNDRDVDVSDIVAAASAWNRLPSAYLAATDADWDGVNGLTDVQIVASQFGQNCP